MGTFCEIAPRWMPPNLKCDMSILIKAMAWCHRETSHSLRPSSMLPYGVTTPQWGGTFNYLPRCRLLDFYLVSSAQDDPIIKWWRPRSKRFVAIFVSNRRCLINHKTCAVNNLQAEVKLLNVKSICTSVNKLSIAELAPGWNIDDDIMTTKRLAHYWSFKRGILWSPRYPKDQ